MDGNIVKAESAINEAAITGESMPVTKGPGDLVYAQESRHGGRKHQRRSGPGGGDGGSRHGRCGDGHGPGDVVVFDKFVPDDEEPSVGRRLFNVVANVLFSDVTRKLGPILSHTSLRVEYQETTSVYGMPYNIVLLRKPA